MYVRVHSRPKRCQTGSTFNKNLCPVLKVIKDLNWYNLTVNTVDPILKISGCCRNCNLSVRVIEHSYAFVLGRTRNWLSTNRCFSRQRFSRLYLRGYVCSYVLYSLVIESIVKCHKLIIHRVSYWMFHGCLKLHELLSFRWNGSTNRECSYSLQEEFLTGTVI